MRKNISIFGQKGSQKAFALPTVLIASVVLLIVLAVSVTATATVRETLKAQYYNQLAQVAGEAGVAYAKACLAASGNVPTWTDAKPLTPASDCNGNVVLTPNVRALVVAGGGSGGGSTGGGGGGGGVTYNDTVTVSVASYPVVVGAGAAAPGNKARGISGGSSSFNGISTLGGGGGAYSASATVGATGFNGGSGGGGQSYSTTVFNPGGGQAGQGNAGGAGINANTGGGGGAGGVGGTNATLNVGANGGPGLPYSITGSIVYYGAGGGGGNGGIAGIGGNQTPGPVGGPVPAAPANSGAGGTGGWAYADGNGGAGGSGIVVVAFPIDSGIVATGGTVTTSNGYEIHKFTASGTFQVTSTGSSSCPSDPACSVTLNGNIRSSFSVPKPTVDSQGRAVTIPNSGYTEITRSSNGAVWRTYKQPSVQNAVVPDLCSGNATAARGWGAAVKVTSQDSLASASSAQTISLADTSLNAGVVYYRRDFNASVNATYTLNVYTSSVQDNAATYIDGNLVSTAAGSVSTTQTVLTPGCHTMVVALTNDTYLPRPSDFTLSLTRSGAAAPVVVSDTSWRVVTGDPTHFSMYNYDETPNSWAQVSDFGAWNNTALAWTTGPSTFGSVSGDVLADWISVNNGTPGNAVAPGSSYAWFRDPTPFTTSSPVTVRVTTYCDNKCDLYLDGTAVMNPSLDSGVVSKNITIQPGTHTFGVRLFNGNTSANPAGFLFAAVDLTNNKTLERSSPNWDSTTGWQTSASEPYSYDANYTPTPAVQTSTNAKVLVVGGGGGGGSDMGGGGGGGGVIYNAAYPLSTGTYNVTVGAGGVGAPPGQSAARGANGGNSVFASLYTSIRSLGGGGGATEYASNISPPGSGASAGGSAAYLQTLRAAGVIGMGYDSVANGGQYYPSGGGGAGGPGATNVATGGIGVSNNILGTAYFWGGGGGGSGYTPLGGNGGAGGGGGGAVGTTTGGSGINPGSPGGGGVQVAQTNKPGGNGGTYTGGGGGGGSHYNANNYGGNGGSGVVIVSFPTGVLSVSAVTNATDMSSGTPGFTTYMFTSNGYITISAIN
jgi:hypothetical protein